MLKKIFRFFKNRNFIAITTSILILLFSYISTTNEYSYVINKNIQDLNFIENDIKASKDIIVVEIDEETLSGRKDRNGKKTIDGLGRYPFDRKYYAQVIDNLNSAGTSIIGLDIIFGEESNTTSDKILADSIKKAGNVILGMWTNNHGLKPNSDLGNGFWYNYESEINKPYAIFNKHIFNTGFLEVKLDTRTENVYGFFPFAKFLNDDNLYQHFAIAILRSYYSKIYNDNKFTNGDIVNSEYKFIINDKIELLKSRANSKEVLINYSYDKNTDRIRTYKSSFLDIYNNNFDKNYFKNKIVLIGATAAGTKDIFHTPVGQQYGVYLHANIINTIITKNGIMYLNPFLEFFIIFLIIIISVYFNLSISGKVLFISNFFLFSLNLFIIYYITLFTSYLPNFPFELMIGLMLALALSSIIKYVIEYKNKDKLNKALSEYVSEDVAKEILSGEGKINLDGEKKNVAIFFSDIEGFTTISEKFSPEELVHFLRDYLSNMSNIILDEGGFINKYEGDAIMALWGVFGYNSLEPYNICLAALKQQQTLKKLNFSWRLKGFSTIKARIGLHFGSAIIGNIGSEGRKMEFTALGDSVNLASRLEGVNKYYGTYICASEDIYKTQKEFFEFRYLDTIKVKGKNNAIKIYELLALKGKLTKIETDKYFDFRVGISRYHDMKFEEALTIFTKLSDLKDGPSITYKKRCEFYIKEPPGNRWDGVWVMKDK